MPTVSITIASGACTVEVTEPSAARSCRTWIGPRGVGYVPSAQASDPSRGSIRARANPGSSGVTPSTWRLSHEVGPLAQPWQRLCRKPS